MDPENVVISTPEVSATPVPPAVPVAPEPPAVPPAGQLVNPPEAPVAVAPVPATPAEQNAREYAASLGFQVPAHFQDDGAFIQALLAEAQQASQLRQMQPYAQEYMQHAPAFRQWQAAQQTAAQQQAQPAKPKWWNPPEYDASWERALERDEQGNLRVRAGQDPSILNRYQAFQQYRQQFADRLLSNPEAALGPMVEERAQTIAQKAVQDHLQAYRDSVESDSYLRNNSSWMVQAHPTTGQQMLTPAGQTFQRHFSQAQQRGIRGQSNQIDYAESMTRHDLAMERLSQLQAQSQGDAAKAQVTAANRVPNQGGSNNPARIAEVPQNANLSLRDQLLANMRAGGITDEVIANQIR